MSIRSSCVFSLLPRVGPSTKASPVLRLELQAKSVSSIITRLSFHIIQNWQIMSHPLGRYDRIFLQLLLVISLAFGGVATAAPIYSYKVIARYPHSTESYTEGFFYLNGMFYEGTGKTGRSAVLVIEPKTGKSCSDGIWRLSILARESSTGVRIFTSGHGRQTFVSSTTAQTCVP